MKLQQFEPLARALVLVVVTWMIACGTRSHAANPDHRPGMIIVAKVEGNVEAVDPKGKTTLKLKANDRLTEKYTVNVGMASSATLAFSNGAVINLLENTTLVISQFLQDPFASPFASSAMTEEPTTSVTKLQLVKGQIVGNVKKLRTEKGSSLIVNTPVGAAGVRGTTLAVSYLPPASGNGVGTYTLSVTEGEVEFIDSKGNKRLVTAGKEIVIRFMQSTDTVTGEITIEEILEITIQDIPADRQALIDRVAAEGNQSSELIFIDVLDQDLFEFYVPHAFEQVIVKPPPVTTVDP